jgi:hypothetical protein
MAGRHRSVVLANAGLDDLFEDGDEPVASVRARRPWLLRAVLPAFAVTAVAYTLSHALGVAPPLLLIVALVTGGFLIREATVSSREPRSRRVRDVVRPRLRARTTVDATSFRGAAPFRGAAVADASTDGASADGVLTAVAVWDRRLERARAAPRHAAALLVTHLGELADERLRQRHGLTTRPGPGPSSVTPRGRCCTVPDVRPPTVNSTPRYGGWRPCDDGEPQARPTRKD